MMTKNLNTVSSKKNFSKGKSQTFLNKIKEMRIALYDWLCIVYQKMNLPISNLLLTIDLSDRVIVRSSTQIADLLLLAAACMSLAIKYDGLRVTIYEILTNVLKNEYEKHQLVSMEVFVLKTLGFCIKRVDFVEFNEKMTENLFQGRIFEDVQKLSLSYYLLMKILLNDVTFKYDNKKDYQNIIIYAFKKVGLKLMFNDVSEPSVQFNNSVKECEQKLRKTPYLTKAFLKPLLNKLKTYDFE